MEAHLVRQLNNGKPALLLTHSLSSKAEQLVKSCKYITAICCENVTDSKIITGTEEVIIKNCKLWDLHEMLREVF